MAGHGVNRLRAVLGALWTALRREQESLMKVPANNLYYAAAAFFFILDPAAAVFVGAIVAMVLFFPLSSDPLRHIPASRFQLWPLTRGERRLVRMLSPFLNPVTWVVVAFALWRKVSLGLGALAIGIFLLAFVASDWIPQGKGRAWRWMPRWPGQLGELVRKDLRGLVRTLDFYCALLVGGGAAAYRLAGLLPADAHLPVTLLAMLAISTCAQTPFGLDGRAGMTRYRLLPLRGWQILLAKDVAYLLVCVLLTAALDASAGLAAGLASLAAARKPAVQERRVQLRWRLQAGTAFGGALTQIIAQIAAASFTHLQSRLFLIPFGIGWAISLWWGGRELDG